MDFAEAQAAWDDTPATTPADNRLAFARLLMNGRPHELRALRNGKTFTGIYATPEGLAAGADECNLKIDTYVTLNPITLPVRDFGEAQTGDCTGDHDVAFIRWFAIDLDCYDDPEQLPRLKEYLDSLGWPQPLVMASGGGYWLLYRYDAENTDADTTLRSRALQRLHDRFPAVDTSVFNASRIVRFAGTKNLKRGRQSYLITPHDIELQTLQREALVELVGPTEEPKPKMGTPTNFAVLKRALGERGIEITGSKPARKAPGAIHQLSDCPFRPGGHPQAPTVTVWADGNVSFNCLGAKCQAAEHGILDLEELLGITSSRPADSHRTSRDFEFNFLELDQEPPKIAYLEEPFVPMGAFLFFVGAEGSSKTAVARWIALRAALRGHTVIYFSEDNPADRDRNYLGRMLAGMGQDNERLPPKLRFVSSSGVDLSLAPIRNSVLELIKKITPDLVVFDNYISMFGGGMAAQKYESWDAASAFSTLLKQVRPICNPAVVTLCNGPASAPTSLPGGAGLRAVADLVVEFRGRYRGGDVSDFKMANTKGTRYPVYDYEGRVTGPDDDVSPLVVELKKRGTEWPKAPSSGSSEPPATPSRLDTAEGSSSFPKVPAPPGAGPGSTTPIDLPPPPSAIRPGSSVNSASRTTTSNETPSNETPSIYIERLGFVRPNGNGQSSNGNGVGRRVDAVDAGFSKLWKPCRTPGCTALLLIEWADERRIQWCSACRRTFRDVRARERLSRT
jgi:KaiC/GvpD/RAD55 family RecA-like ATPase